MGPAEGNEESIANELEENLRERSDTGERRECGKKYENDQVGGR